MEPEAARVVAAPRPAPRGRSRFYLVMACVALTVAVVGFWKASLVSAARGRPELPGVLQLHGGLYFAWVLLFVAQPVLIRSRRKFTAHRVLGFLGAGLAVAMAVSTVAVGLHVAERDLAAGDRTGVSGLIGIFTGMAIFLALVLSAVHFRAKPEIHKRLMLLATIAVLWPAWFRLRHFFPWVPRPDIVFGVIAADSLILVAMIRDRWVLGRIHPVYRWLGPALILEHLTEALLFDSAGWRVVAGALYRALT